MGYPQNTLKIVLGGGAATDIWRTTIDFRVTSAAGTPSAAALNALITSAIQPGVLTFWNSIKANNMPAFSYNFLACYYFPAGASTAASAGLGTIATVPGTAASTTLPYRTAIVATKVTGFAGQANKGRAYLPFTGGSALGADGQASQALCNSFASAYSTLLTTLNGADWNTTAGLTGQKAVVTSATAVNVAHDVVSIRVDSLPDTQRRRTNKDNPSAVSVQPV